MRKDGRLLDLSLTISPIKDNAGRVVGASKVARDISERKWIEQTLAERVRLLDLSNDAIWFAMGRPCYVLEQQRVRSVRL